MNRQQRIYEKLTERFAPNILEVYDESMKHRNHLPEHHGHETHYLVVIAGSEFIGLSKIEQHRKVHRALQSEFAAGLHSLQIKVLNS